MEVPPSTLRFYRISQWSRGAPGSLWEVADSNQGLLPQKSGELMLYSQTKGVKQKYILCISGLVAYRQYIHNSSSLVDPCLAHGGESNIYFPAPPGLVTPLLGWSPLRLSADESSLRNDSRTPELAPLSSAGGQLSLQLSSLESKESPFSASAELTSPRMPHPIQVWILPY